MSRKHIRNIKPLKPKLQTANTKCSSNKIYSGYNLKTLLLLFNIVYHIDRFYNKN